MLNLSKMFLTPIIENKNKTVRNLKIKTIKNNKY